MVPQLSRSVGERSSLTNRKYQSRQPKQQLVLLLQNLATEARGAAAQSNKSNSSEANHYIEGSQRHLVNSALCKGRSTVREQDPRSQLSRQGKQCDHRQICRALSSTATASHPAAPVGVINRMKLSPSESIQKHGKRIEISALTAKVGGGRPFNRTK